MAKGLTLKQRRFIKYYTDPNSETFGNQSKSALKAGYKQWISGNENLKKPKVKDEIERILNKLGVTDEMLFNRLISIIKDYDENTKDRTNALQAMRLLWELKGSFPAKKVEEKLEVEDNLSALTRKDIEDLKKTLRLSLKQGEN